MAIKAIYNKVNDKNAAYQAVKEFITPEQFGKYEKLGKSFRSKQCICENFKAKFQAR